MKTIYKIISGILSLFLCLFPDKKLKAKTKTHLTKSQVVKYGEKYLGIPYVWGGDRPELGLDCSGLALIVLRKIEKNKSIPDMTSHSMYTYMQKTLNWKQVNSISEITTDDFLFYKKKKSGRIYHVAMVSAPGYMLESGGKGSGSKCTDLSVARKRYPQAKVRIIPIAGRRPPDYILRKYNN